TPRANLRSDWSDRREIHGSDERRSEAGRRSRSGSHVHLRRSGSSESSRRRRTAAARRRRRFPLSDSATSAAATPASNGHLITIDHLAKTYMLGEIEV